MPSRQEGSGGLLDAVESGRGSPSALPLKSLTSLRWWKHLFWPRTTSVHSGSSGEDSMAPKKQLRPTAYLDGLRGWAAFMVYFHHHQLWTHALGGPQDGYKALESAWGWNGHYYLATFYGIKTFFIGGHLAVANFFVISGYVLILKPLSLIQAGDLPKAYDNLSSALFRRWFRLFLPLIITTFIYITIWHVFGVPSPQTVSKPTYGEELWSWYVEFKNFSFIFKEGWLIPYFNGHLWTIPFEMRGSLVVYVALLAFAHATTTARLLGEIALMIYFMYIADGWYGAVFVSGMFQCDLDLLSRKPDGAGFPSFLRRLEPYKTPLAYAAFAASMFLGGLPTFNNDVAYLRENPGWTWLSYLKPQAVFDYKWFFLFWAANFLVFAVPRIPWLKRFFETRFCQYLGHISFALYLVHGPVLSLLGDWLYYCVGWGRPDDPQRARIQSWFNVFPLPQNGPLGFELAFWLPQIILLPATMWCADFTTRIADEPAVKFSQWLYRKATQGSTEPKPESVNLMRLA